MPSEVATVLHREMAKVDVGKPLSEQGADDLDVVEIVMAVEEAFDVEIPDAALGDVDTPGAIGKSLTVEKLAAIVARQKPAKR